jgi:signal transduction histidine kinase
MPGTQEKDIITIVLVGSFITLLVVAFLVSFVYFYQRRHFAFLREKEQIQSKFQEELLKTQLEIQEETFKTISEEIHDNIGQTLSFVKLNMNTLHVTLREGEEETWQESKDLLTRVIQDLRNLSRSLNTDFIQDIGFINAVRQQLALLEKTGLYTTSLVVSGEQQSYSVHRELVLFRIVQESLNNIVKHAEATQILIRMHYKPERLSITVEDDGKGFEAERTTRDKNGGIGLRNMINRITLINGSIRINSSPGKGTLVSIDLLGTNEL